jgi:hypothetical protein
MWFFEENDTIKRRNETSSWKLKKYLGDNTIAAISATAVLKIDQWAWHSEVARYAEWFWW